MVNDRASQIAEKNNTEVTKETKQQAIKQIVSERIIVRIAASQEDADLLNKLLKAGVIRPFYSAEEATAEEKAQPGFKPKGKLFVGEQIVDGKRFTTEVFQIDSKKRQELESDKELGDTYKKIFSRLQLLEFSSSTKESSKILEERLKNKEMKTINTTPIQDYINAINNPELYDQFDYKSEEEYLKATKQAAIESLTKDLSLFQTLDLDLNELRQVESISGASKANIVKQREVEIENLLIGLVKQIQNNPKLKNNILVTDAIQTVERAAGRTRGGIFQAYNFNDTIILTPAITLDKDRAARVLEEEALEVNLKNKLGFNFLNPGATGSVKRIISQVKRISNERIKDSKGKPTKKLTARAFEARKILKELINKYSDTKQGNFEFFVTLTQNLYGEKGTNYDSVQDLFKLLDNKYKDDINASILSSYSGAVRDSLVEKMPIREKEKAEDIKTETETKGKTEVEKFIETTPDTPAKKLRRQSRKIQEAKQKAIKSVEKQIKTLPDPIQIEFAKEVLRILTSEEYSDDSKVERKRKRALRKLHTTYPQITYSFLPNENTPDYDQEIENTETSSSDMEFDSTHGDRFFREKIPQQIISKSNRRTGTMYILMLRDADWFINAISSYENYVKFKNSDPVSSLELLVQEIAQNNTLEEMRSFHRANISNHIQRYVKQLNGTMVVANAITPFEEMYNSVLDVHDNPDLKLEHYEKLLPLIDKGFIV